MTVATALACDLCNLPVRGNAFERSYEGEARRFCCAGCLNVYAILHESGSLQDRDSTAAYRIGAQLGLLSSAAENDSAQNPPPPLDIEQEPHLSVEREIEVPIGGMWCSSCAWLIERVVRKQSGVLACQVNFVSDAARIRYRPALVSRQQILDQIRLLGYTPGAPGQNPAGSVQRDLLVRFGVACAPGMYMMMFNIFLYEGYFNHLDEGIRSFLHQLLLFLSLPIMTWCAWPIYRKAWAALKHGAATMETLITLGAGSAFLYSVYATIQRQPQVYFDTASMLITLVLLGKYLEAAARARATSAIGSLSAMLPRKVRLRLPDGEERTVAADQVQPGDLAIVEPGATVPVDGIIVDGVAALDESLLTGEPVPVRRVVGDEVVGASLCVEGGIIVRAVHTGKQTTVSRMADVVRDAMEGRSGSERLADRVSRVFVPCIIAIAALVFLHGLQTHPLQDALMRAVSVLVVACPCALGMATPLAIAAAMGSAARRGILIRNSQSMEKAQKIDTLLLDKTGTVTLGRLQVVQVITVGDQPATKSQWEAVASLESLSQHPAARAIVTWIRTQGYSTRADVEMEVIPGRGIRGRVGGISVAVGMLELHQSEVVETGIARQAEAIDRTGAECPLLPPHVSQQIEGAEAEGKTVVLASCGGKLLCAFILADVLRHGSAEAVKDLQTAGIDVWLISGDSAATTSAIGERLGIAHIISRALPSDKIERVRELKRNGRRVAMVGDGINDGPALAEADLGVAMGEGTQLALEAADLALLSGDLRRLPYALQLSTRTVRIIRQNLFWALIYNVAVIPAAAGLYGPRLSIGPLFAAVAMLTSSLSVVFNSLRLQDNSSETRTERKGVTA